MALPKYLYQPVKDPMEDGEKNLSIRLVHIIPKGIMGHEIEFPPIVPNEKEIVPPIKQCWNCEEQQARESCGPTREGIAFSR